MTEDRKRVVRRVAVVLSIVCGILGSILLGLVALWVVAFAQWGSAK